MKTKLSVLVISLLLAPSLVFAAWWNPSSWFKKRINIEQQTTISTNLPVSSSSTKVADGIKPNFTETEKKKEAKKTSVKNDLSVKVKPITPPTVSSTTIINSQASLILGCSSVIGFSTITGLSCNGNGTCQSGSFFDKNSNKCVSSFTYCQNLNGPYTTYNSGNNSCECLTGYSLDSKNTCVVQKTGYQVCSEMNAIWDGVSKNSNGGFSCTCKTGFVSSSDGKTCSPQNGYQVCSQAYQNETWDGTYSSDGKFNCICLSGYVLNDTKTGCELPKVDTTLPSTYIPSYSSYGLGRNKGEVVLSKSGCDYYLVETSLGYSLLEWYGGFYQDEGDIIFGNLNSYGFKDISNANGRDGRVYIDDYMLSKSRAIEKYYDKCD